MLDDLKNTIKHSAVYGVSRVASKALSFVFIPMYTAIYAPDTVGKFYQVEPFWQYLLTICLFGFETTIITHCTTQSEDNRKKLLFNFLTILLFNCFVFLLAGILFNQNFTSFILHQDKGSNVIFYAFLVCIFESLITLPLCIARLKNKPGLYSAIALTSLFLNFFLQVYFVYFQKKDFDFIFIAKFAAPMIVFLFCIPLIINNVKINFDKTNLRQIINFSFFWMLYSIITMLLNTADRYILAYYVPMEQIGIYGIGYSVGSLTNSLVLVPFSLAFSGLFYKKVNEENAERYFTKMSTYLFFAMTFVSLVGALIMPEAVKLFVRNPALWNAINIIRIILYANCALSLFTVISFSFLYKKESKIVTWYSLIALIFNVAGNIIFDRYYGIYAAGILSVLSNILLIVLLYMKSKHYYFIKLEAYKLVLLSVLYIGLVYLSVLVKQDNLLLNTGINVILVVIFFLLLYVGRFFENIEIYSIKGAINKYLKINLFRKTS
ncbi:MAG: oligosaccharide flippase family protein [Bacteroidetes bacterium]|nr:oligosaccharide flippase family protein [Bacteroidota bacterium]